MNVSRILYATLIILFSSVIKANAQISIGLDAGVTINKLDYKNINENILINSETGYITDVLIQYKLNKYFIFEITPSQLQKNYSIKNKNGVYQKINNKYLQLPFNVQYNLRLTHRISTYGALGLYYSYWLTSKVFGIAPNAFNIEQTSSDQLIKLQKIKYLYAFNSEQDNRSEYGWVGKVGIDYNLNKRLSFSLKGHIYQSVMDQQKKIVEQQTSKYNQTLAATIGLSYSLH